MTNPVLIDQAALRRRGIPHHNSTLLRLEAKGQFPKRVRVGAKKFWLAEELDDFIASLSTKK